MGDIDMLGRATAAVRAVRKINDSDPEVVARAVLEAAGVLGADAQPSPLHQPGEPSMHDLAGEWLAGVGIYPASTAAAVQMLEARKAFGLAKYGTALQVSGPRDPRADAADEVADALVYAQQALERARRFDVGPRLAFWLRRRDALGFELLALMEGPRQ